MRTSVTTIALAFVLALAAYRVALADDDDDPQSPAQIIKDVENRLPQPVRAGDLVGREVLQPVATRAYLGRVRELVDGKDGIDVVVDYGGWFGFGTRPIAVPVAAMTLLGPTMEIVAFTPGQLRAFPTFDPAGAKPVAPDASIEVGLSRPSH